MILGTRGSGLALAQADRVEALLKEFTTNIQREIIKSTGDTFTDRPLHEVGGVGVFVRELDDRMFAGEVDIAVHSMKDLPTQRPEGLALAAVLKRDSPYDVLLTKDGLKIDELPEASVIGTTSMRRRAQLLRYRPDLEIKDLRGNIHTRIRKLNEGQYDGILLAKAGLERMGWDMNAQPLDPEDFCPSANQGTIAVVTRVGEEAEELCSKIDHAESRLATEVERLIIRDVEGGCIVPIGSFAKVIKNGKKIHIRAEVLSLDGDRAIRIDEKIPVDGYREHALELGKNLADLGGRDLVYEAVERLGISKVG
ncbi:hydroxymethylbilane synthase [Methanohalophilus levihalophilus]|uniref:hydroxymethylbilane synthase n=1 Tax=Methanohalophilus levihalophilus TaxID=1431282 RepID=UPI001AEB9537|nr:hydroxymethylbilane synthase [Methanohalophilus levihalophilus]MBP2031056.1 hydroxymethylbilane synthase [Methanohalophilus levihalophilus]